MTQTVAATSFWDWRERLKAQLSGTVATQAADPEVNYEADADPAPVDERLIQAIWHQQLIQAAGLRLADGRPVRVLESGRWNGSAGPDFKGARLIIGEQTLEGDIEVHLVASGWAAHGHERDLDYNSCILHVVLRNDDGGVSDRLHNGTLLPRLELEPYIFPDLETVRRSLSIEEFQCETLGAVGRCHRMLTSLDSLALADFLDHAGNERLVGKVQRLEQQASQADLEQVFYQSLMMALGTGPGKTLYYLLAKRAPLAELLAETDELPEGRRAEGIEALLLAVAGLLPEPAALAEAPEEARARAERMVEMWRRWQPCWCDRQIAPTRRWFQGIRPVNFPTRRLAGVAVLLARTRERGRSPLADLLGRIEAGRGALESSVPARRKRHPVLEDLVGWFRVAGMGHFWGSHYSFTAKPTPRPMDLIGEGAALSLVLNALVPAALLAARRAGDERLDQAVRRLYGLVPPLQANHVTAFMERRLFGDSDWARGLINTERRRQALFQIFHHCCRGETRDCDACYFGPGR